MNHPRYSVLSLFDPLNASPTPKREVVTPDSGSDKENSEPRINYDQNQEYLDSDKLTMTAFFNRIQPKSKQYAPVAFKTRLVDVGDTTVTVTIDEASELMGDLTITNNRIEPTEDEEEQEQKEFFLATGISTVGNATHEQSHIPIDVPQTPQNVQRAPLADLSPDSTPMPKKKQSNLPNAPSTPALDHHALSATAIRINQMTIAPSGSPLASMINTTNLTAQVTEITEVSSPTDDLALGACIGGQSHPPSIVVSLSADDSLESSTAHLVPSPSASLLAKASLSESITLSSPPSTLHDTPHFLEPSDSPSQQSSQVRLRPQSTLSSLDPRRTSVDLHSSFNWQLQCPEASFDLLNDRISFFGQDSFLNDVDDFDMQAEEAMMMALAERLKDKDSKETPMRSPESADEMELSANIADESVEVCTENVFDSISMVPQTPVIDKNTTAATSGKKKRSSIPSLSGSPSLRQTSGSNCSDDQSTHKEQLEAANNHMSLDMASSESTVFTDQDNSTSFAQTPSKPDKPLVAPAPIQALRIVKRPKLHDRMSSTFSVKSSISGRSVAKELTPVVVGSSVPSIAAPVAPAQPTHKPILTGLLRPLPGLMPSSSQNDLPAKASDRSSLRSKLTGMSMTRPASKSVSQAVEEDAHPAHTEKPGANIKSRLQRPGKNLGPNSSTLSTTTSTKLPAPATSTTIPKSLRPPSRFGSLSSASGATSALPRPITTSSSVSRLPALSGSKMKLPTGSVAGVPSARSSALRRT
ncbi:hypothetical protein BJ138DRAFT_1149973 [Hygrophoropsis aurantiaca]|uniref:Uncharacterized protein n=1 Tax=Hygrophoropsis aurantiaca TaxID=72124 RepID=A0ACB8AF03_9AGAM|nr:hypothetical protein BJ138DRAFT_1149973 [Hygrophoropsis aurantiaca]